MSTTREAAAGSLPKLLPGKWGDAAPEEMEGFVVLTLHFRRVDKATWFGECLELGTATNARTLNRTHDELVDLVLLHLNSLEEAGEREKFFKKHKITFYRADQKLAAVQVEVPVRDDGVFIHPHTVALAKAA